MINARTEERKPKSMKQLTDRYKREERRKAREQADRWLREQSYPVREDTPIYRP